MLKIFIDIRPYRFLYYRCTRVYHIIGGSMSKNITFFQFQRKFSTNLRCYKYLFCQRWPDEFICPRCHHNKYSYHSTRGLYQCKNCHYQASVTAGTIFHKTRTPLKIWFWMIFLISRNKTGSSLLYMMRLLEMKCYKTAWTMAHKIHKAMQENDQSTKLSGLIELDDAYFGERNVTGKVGRGAARKKPVLIAVGTRVIKGKRKPSYLKMKVSSDMTKENVEEFVDNCISPGSTIKTDKFKSYAFLNNKGYEHEAIRIYNPKETLEYLPWVHIMIGNIKGILKGVHHGVSPKHLQRFLSEFCYKFNRRFNEKRMFDNLVLACINTKTITFTELRT